MENVLIFSLSIITISNIFMVFILKDIFDRLTSICGMYLECNPDLIDSAMKLIEKEKKQNGKND